MKCDNMFCVYEENGKCALAEISLNAQGQCQECIQINLEKNALETAKAHTLRSLN